MMWRNWDDFFYDCADFFFGKQMDKAYEQGIRAGAEYATRKMSFAVHSVKTKEMTKTQRIGHDAVIEAIIPVKKEIMRETGAML